VTVEKHVVTATIDPGGLNIVAPILSGTLTMDQAWVPYHQASITIADTGMDLSPYLPANVLPVRIDAEVVGQPDLSEQWNLHARQIRQDFLAGTYTIDLASAEALVQDWGVTPVSVAFAADRSLSLICRDILRQVLGDSTINVGADTLSLQIDNNLRVWAAGTSAWDYLAEICNSMGGRTLSPTPFGGWTIRPPVPIDVAPAFIPQPEDALSYVQEWTREGDDFGNAVTVEYTGGDPTYTTIAVPGSSPAVSVQVEVKRYGQGYLPITATAKPPLVKALDTSVPSPRTTPQSSRDKYATNVRRRRESLGFHLTWRVVSNYGVRPRSSISSPSMYIERVIHDFGTNEMTVSAHVPYSGEPV
jgi:hypothetical protein